MGVTSSIIGNSAASTSSTSSTATGLSTDLSTFLKLLTTQLQNQDPTQPVDSSQFTQQLATLTSVQAQNNTNTLLQQLVNNSQSTQISSASAFIGTTVQATGNTAQLANGTATFAYSLPSTATTATVTIKDSNGNTVYQGTGPTASGNNVVEWNGLNSFNSSTEPDGTYSISVTATDANGGAITPTPFITGVVDSATITNGTIMLDINGLKIPSSSVTSITGIGANTTSSGSTSGTTSGSTSS